MSIKRLSGGTLFSGIGSPELAAPHIDWRWCAETDPFASAVLAARFPHSTNLGDVTTVDWHAVEPVDLLVFGSPCQSFSVAGKRAGLDDPRGNLALHGLQVARQLRPRWLVFENVPGLLSSDDGRDFGAFLGLLGECGYHAAWRVLDAQHFGVPQRRRRVFVVGHLGDWRAAAAVLFEPESLRGDPSPRRETGERVAPVLSARATAGLGTDFDCDAGLIAYGGNNTSGPIELATAVNAHGGPHGRQDFETETFVTHPLAVAFAENSRAELRLEGGDGQTTGALKNGGGKPGQSYPAVAFSVRSDAMREGVALTPSADAEGRVRLRDPGLGIYADLAPTVEAGAAHAVAFTERTHSRQIMAPQVVSENGSDVQIGSESTGAISTGQRAGHADNIVSQMSVRRLTPVECEKLQGFPPGFTGITFRSKPAADGPRYRALGNAMATPVVNWLLNRIPT